MGRDRSCRQLAELSGLGEGALVLDLGCGIGGPARVLSHEWKFRMVGIDLVDDFIATAVALTELVRLSERIDFLQSEATRLPFASKTFDGAVLQHTTVNIPDKFPLLTEVARVLRTNGILVMHDWLRGVGPDPVYPMPWSKDGSLSYLLDKPEFAAVARKTGFEIVVFNDMVESYIPRLEGQIKDARQEQGRIVNQEKLTELVSYEESLERFRTNLIEKRLVCYMAKLRKTG